MKRIQLLRLEKLNDNSFAVAIAVDEAIKSVQFTVLRDAIPGTGLIVTQAEKEYYELLQYDDWAITEVFRVIREIYNIEDVIFPVEISVP